MQFTKLDQQALNGKPITEAQFNMSLIQREINDAIAIANKFWQNENIISLEVSWLCWTIKSASGKYIKYDEGMMHYGDRKTGFKQSITPWETKEIVYP